MPLAINAQNDFRKGYIITNANDTVYGNIEYASDKSNTTMCNFIQSGQKKAIEYTPYDILGYKLDESGKFFVSKEIKLKNGTNRIFLEYLINGKLNIFYYRDELSTDHYLIHRDSFPMMELPPLEKEIERDGTIYRINDEKSKSILSFFTDDCPELRPQIEKLYLEHKPLIKLAKEYHKLVCSDAQCIIYEKKAYPFVLYIEPVFGFTHYNGSKLNSCNYGFQVYNWIPRYDERFYFKTGFLMQEGNLVDTKSKFIRIPIIVEYQYPIGKLKPTLAIGQNILYICKEDNPTIITTPVEIGLLYSLTKKIKFSLNYNIEFAPLGFLILPEGQQKIIANSINCGIRVKL